MMMMRSGLTPADRATALTKSCLTVSNSAIVMGSETIAVCVLTYEQV